MKNLILLTLFILFLPLTLIALWVVFSDPNALNAEDHYPVLTNGPQTKGA